MFDRFKEVFHIEINVGHLLLLSFFPRPGGRDIIIYLLKRQQPSLWRTQSSPAFTGHFLFPTQKRRIEFG